jgi:hypothetical protein
MFYVVHHGRVLGAATDFTPHPNSARWAPGQIAHFTAGAASLPDDLEDAFLIDRQGTAWHIEILAVAAPGVHSYTGATVRLLRRLPAHQEILTKVREHAARSTPFRPRTLERHAQPEHQGAA